MGRFNTVVFTCCIAFVITFLFSRAEAAELKSNPFSVHVIDTQSGEPGRGMQIILERQNDQQWERLAEGRTDENGRINDIYPSNRSVEMGTYRLIFDTNDYFRSRSQAPFFPKIEILFQVDDTEKHYHIPLLVTPFGYSTYRGN